MIQGNLGATLDISRFTATQRDSEIEETLAPQFYTCTDVEDGWEMFIKDVANNSCIPTWVTKPQWTYFRSNYSHSYATVLEPENYQPQRRSEKWSKEGLVLLDQNHPPIASDTPILESEQKNILFKRLSQTM